MDTVSYLKSYQRYNFEKIVRVTVNIDDAYSYDYTVKVPSGPIDESAAGKLRAYDADLKTIKLGNLGTATMQMLFALGHAMELEQKPGEEERCWGLRVKSRVGSAHQNVRVRKAKLPD